MTISCNASLDFLCPMTSVNETPKFGGTMVDSRNSDKLWSTWVRIPDIAGSGLGLVPDEALGGRGDEVGRGIVEVGRGVVNGVGEDDFSRDLIVEANVGREKLLDAAPEVFRSGVRTGAARGVILPAGGVIPAGARLGVDGIRSNLLARLRTEDVRLSLPTFDDPAATATATLADGLLSK